MLTNVLLAKVPIWFYNAIFSLLMMILSLQQ